MKLGALSLPTHHFEEYLSFLTEVLELDHHALNDHSMELHLEDTVLIITKTKEQVSALVQVGFTFGREEFSALIQKINFYYYRKGPTRFLLLKSNDQECHLIDPDGRLWRFSPQNLTSSII